MKLELPDCNEEETSDEIKVKVWTERTTTWLEPPILVQKHELTRWNGEFEFEDGELCLQDGYCENWTEVNDCVSLLKGLEVDVTFDNIKVLTTFGLQFSIDPLLEEIGKWFKSILNTDNFGKTVNIIHKLKKLGFSEEQLANQTTLINVFIDFVNNCSRDKFTELMSTEFNEINLVILKALFRGENNHFDILLKSLADKIDSDEHCEIVLDILKNMLLSEQVEVLCVFSSEVNLVIMQIQSLSPSKKSLKAAIRFLAALNEKKSDRGIETPRFISLGLLQRTRCWRRYSFGDLKLLNENPNLECWHFTEIVLDWLKLHHEQNDDYRENLNCSQEMINDRIKSDINKNEFISLEEYKDLIYEELDYLFSNTQESSVQKYRRLYSELSFWKFCGTFFRSGNWRG